MLCKNSRILFLWWYTRIFQENLAFSGHPNSAFTKKLLNSARCACRSKFRILTIYIYISYIYTIYTHIPYTICTIYSIIYHIYRIYTACIPYIYLIYTSRTSSILWTKRCNIFFFFFFCWKNSFWGINIKKSTFYQPFFFYSTLSSPASIEAPDGKGPLTVDHWPLAIDRWLLTLCFSLLLQGGLFEVAEP